MREPIRILMKAIIKRIFDEHNKQHYIYTLEEVAGADREILVRLTGANERDVKTLEKWVGESQIEMLYDSADAEVIGLGLSSRLKHEIFIEYLERKADQGRGPAEPVAAPRRSL